MVCAKNGQEVAEFIWRVGMEVCNHLDTGVGANHHPQRRALHGESEDTVVADNLNARGNMLQSGRVNGEVLVFDGAREDGQVFGPFDQVLDSASCISFPVLPDDFLQVALWRVPDDDSIVAFLTFFFFHCRAEGAKGVFVVPVHDVDAEVAAEGNAALIAEFDLLQRLSQGRVHSAPVGLAVRIDVAADGNPFRGMVMKHGEEVLTASKHISTSLQRCGPGFPL